MPAVPPALKPPPPATPWHARGADEALAGLRSTRAGLDAQEAARRLREHGPNRLPEQRGRRPLLRLLAQFHNALIWFLLAAAVAAGILGHLVDAAVILAVVRPF